MFSNGKKDFPEWKLTGCMPGPGNNKYQMTRTIFTLLVLCTVLSACSIPRIVFLTDPLTAQERNDLGVSYELMGEAELALKEYELAAGEDRNWDQPLINHGNVHAGLENWKQAEQSYRGALKRNPANPEAMNNLAYVLMKQDKNREALTWTMKAVEIQPENPFFSATHGWALLKTDNPEEAEKAFLSALEKTPAQSPLHQHIREGLDQIGTHD